MLVPVFVALFLSCAAITSAFLVYICLLCNAVSSRNDDRRFAAAVKPARSKGLAPSDLEKLPKVAGKDLVLGSDCAVCLEEIETQQPVRMIPGCNHGFHLECADSWLAKNSNCPLCRAQIGPELVTPPDQASPC